MFGGQGQGPELDFINVIALTEDPALRRDMLFQLNAAQQRQLPQNLRRELDNAREDQARAHEQAMRREVERRERERRLAEQQNRFGMMHFGGPNRPNNRRAGEEEADNGLKKLDLVIEKVERDLFEKLEHAGFKAQAKFMERQLETEDTLIETILRLVIQFAEEKHYDAKALVPREAQENAQSSEIIFLIHSLDEQRQTSAPGHSNRNKFANAFALLLSSEIECKDDFKKLIVEEDEDETVAAEVLGMDVDEGRQEATIMIDTTAEGLKRRAAEVKSEQEKAAALKKRSASLKLVLMLIGTMRLISKSFRVHLLKGLLL